MSTRIAVLSDIHANLSAFTAVLADIHSENIKHIFCLGDLVGYYTEPIPVIHLAMARCDVIVKGNHDNHAAIGDIPKHYNNSSLKPIEFTNETLTIRERKILHSFPLMHTESLDNPKQKIMLIHGGPEYPLDQYIFPDSYEDIDSSFEFMDLIDIDVLFLGHTHIPFLVEREGKIICNPGSVGQPRDGDSRAAYAIYDPTNEIRLKRVAYDPTPTIEGVKKHRFSVELGERLLVGK